MYRIQDDLMWSLSIFKGRCVLDIWTSCKQELREDRNASSLPPRLPFISDALKAVERMKSSSEEARHTIVAVSYRGYWTSRGRASQAGLELDAARAIQFAVEHFSSSTSDLRLVLWGQSIGAGIANVAAARYVAETAQAKSTHLPFLRGLVLETPFTSINDMLIALYPQKWLPYRYLGVFLRNSLDSRAAIKGVTRAIANPSSQTLAPKVLILQAENDELVPGDHAAELESLYRNAGLETERRTIRGALHTEVMAKGDGRNAIAQFLKELGTRNR